MGTHQPTMKSFVQRTVGLLFLYLTISGHGLASAAHVTAALRDSAPLLPVHAESGVQSTKPWLMTGGVVAATMMLSAGYFFGSSSNLGSPFAATRGKAMTVTVPHMQTARMRP